MSWGALSNVKNVASRAVFSENLKNCLTGWVWEGHQGESCSICFISSNSTSQADCPKLADLRSLGGAVILYS